MSILLEFRLTQWDMTKGARLVTSRSDFQEGETPLILSVTALSPGG
jgi:hypothetical protein